uniref:Uncharacterized protein n=1 Tax=Bacillus subtilis TaxID=1423 RepID=P94555_BACIU|nr:hypothetical protein [Bacillus subtilis]
MLNKKDADRYDAKQGMQSSKIKLSVPRHYFTPCLISAKCAKSLPPLLSIVSTLLRFIDNFILLLPQKGVKKTRT